MFRNVLKKLKLDQQGFTVLELVTVSVIMVVLLSVFFVNFRGFDNQMILENESEKIFSILKQAQVMALTGQTIGGCRYNYGVHFSECEAGGCEYILFRVPEADDKWYANGEIMTGGEHALNSEVYVDQLSPASGGVLDIVFVAPLAEIYFNNALDDEAQIILKHNLTEETQTISVQRVSGQIDIE